MLSYNCKLLRAAFIAVLATSSAISANIVKIDEFGNGTQDRFPQNPKLKFERAKDPTSGKTTLVYHLPFGFANGDVFLTEPGASTNSDLLRFANGKDLFVFSDSEIINERPPGLADVGVPTGSQPGVPVLTFAEVGKEDSNGFAYTPGPGQPGYPGFAVTYDFLSDGVIPEPDLLPLVALALGGLLLLRSLRSFRQ